MTQRYPFSWIFALILFLAGFGTFVSDAFSSPPGPLYTELEALSLGPGLEALLDGGSEEEEYHELTAHLQDILLKGDGIEHILTRMQKDELTRYRDYLMVRVAQDPDLNEWEAHFRWQSLAALVYHADADMYESKLEKRAVRLAEHHFSRARHLFQDQVEGLPRYYRAHVLDVYKTLIIGPPGVTDVCVEHLRDIEHALKQMEVDALRDLVRNEHDVIFEQIGERRKKASEWLAERVGKKKGFHHSQGAYSYVSAMKAEYRKWFVEMDTIFRGAGYEGFLTFRSKHNPDIAATIRSDAFESMLHTGAIDSLLIRAVGQYKNERSVKASMLEYDLPEEERSAYIRFLPKSYGTAEFGFLLSSFVRSAALSHRYGDRIARSEVVFTNALEDSLASVLKRTKKENISSVLVEFASHGVQGGFQYGKNPISPESIVDLVVTNPDVKFLIRTPACYGGKLRDALLASTEQDGTLHTRVTFFAQSKPDTPNILYFGSALDASVYDIFLLQNLLDTDITSYGEAADYAARMTRRYYWTDAEVVYQGQLMH